MTEKSYFWGDAVPGDDTIYSPYNAAEFNPYVFNAVQGDAHASLNPLFVPDYYRAAFVVPMYLEDLEVVSSGTTSHGITVKPGAATFNNRFYTLDESLSIPLRLATTGTVRRDIVVLRYYQNKIRLAVIEGNEQATPYTNLEMPVLSTTSYKYEVALAVVFVDSAYTYILPTNIDDRRKFLITQESIQKFGPPVNLLKNSEFMGFPGSGTVFNLVGLNGWQISGGAAFSAFDYGSGSPTGRSNGILVAAGGTSKLRMYQWFPAGGQNTFTVGGGFDFTLGAIDRGEITLGLQAYRSNGIESVISKIVTYNSILKESGRDILENNPIAGFTVTFPEDDIDYLYFYIEYDYTATNMSVYQFILTPGYHIGWFRQNNEVSVANYPLTDATWTATAKSTGTTTIDLTTSFGSVAQEHTKFVIVRLRGRDSGSAAGTPYMRLLGYAAPFNMVYGTLELQGITNDVDEEVFVMVPVNHIYWATGVAGARFRIDIAASGVGTFDATAEIVGIVT